ncbi:hypothetical protein J7T55_006609 [Diaporthe amygdali]|uniref:uncharacterized protein n=1 Tax=Phomopsis amygdali TaxID=1214568 RepID=UPI0022FE85CF|nr:uncharacterized protein J7T55_006609 [Diaporthe amygdali]KAJ0125264.1 hypothetical protein J7T55_006609 [Diaporthe amygdali]
MVHCLSIAQGRPDRCASLYACIKVDLCLLVHSTTRASVDLPSTLSCHITSISPGLALRDGNAAAEYTHAVLVHTASLSPVESSELALFQFVGRRTARMSPSNLLHSVQERLQKVRNNFAQNPEPRIELDYVELISPFRTYRASLVPYALENLT